MRTLFLFLVMLQLSAPALVAAQPATLVYASGPLAPVPAGSEQVVTLFFPNRTGQPLVIDLPERLEATLVVGQISSKIFLTRTIAPASLEIAPGGFIEQLYEVELPSDVAGSATIEIRSPFSAAVMLEIIPPTPADAPEVAATTQSRGAQPTTQAGGIVEYVRSNFSAYEPVYFLWGNEDPSVKFQVSLKYQLLNDEGPIAKAFPPATGLHLAYTQTSFWDIGGESAPFFDSSYKPELLIAYEDPNPNRFPIVGRIDFTAGVQHESNGKDGKDSRSLNIVYIRPVITFGDKTDRFVTFSPGVHAYVGGLDENKDIKDYRGYVYLRLVAGQANGLQLAATGRVGDDWGKGSLQLDLTYPVRRLLAGNLDLYLHGQFFTGFGESLLLYSKDDTTFRVGISLVR